MDEGIRIELWNWSSFLLCHRPFVNEQMTVSANRCGQMQADVDQPWLSICATMLKWFSVQGNKPHYIRQTVEK